jgi:hypothetical protein
MPLKYRNQKSHSSSISLLTNSSNSTKAIQLINRLDVIHVVYEYVGIVIIHGVGLLSCYQWIHIHSLIPLVTLHITILLLPIHYQRH